MKEITPSEKQREALNFMIENFGAEWFDTQRLRVPGYAGTMLGRVLLRNRWVEVDYVDGFKMRVTEAGVLASRRTSNPRPPKIERVKREPHLPKTSTNPTYPYVRTAPFSAPPFTGKLTKPQKRYLKFIAENQPVRLSEGALAVRHRLEAWGFIQVTITKGRWGFITLTEAGQLAIARKRITGGAA